VLQHWLMMLADSSLSNPLTIWRWLGLNLLVLRVLMVMLCRLAHEFAHDCVSCVHVTMCNDSVNFGCWKAPEMVTIILCWWAGCDPIFSSKSLVGSLTFTALVYASQTRVSQGTVKANFFTLCPIYMYQTKTTPLFYTDVYGRPSNVIMFIPTKAQSESSISDTSTLGKCSSWHFLYWWWLVLRATCNEFHLKPCVSITTVTLCFHHYPVAPVALVVISRLERNQFSSWGESSHAQMLQWNLVKLSPLRILLWNSTSSYYGL